MASSALVCCTGAFAAQLGQLSTHSHLGEPLLARIELYGLQAREFAGADLELRPEIGVPRDSAERRVLASITPAMARDARGFPYVKLTSNAPVSEPIVSFRLRLTTGTVTNVRHYALALDPPVYRQTRTPPEVVEAATAPSVVVMETPTRSYGPVRSGQTLWRIMQETGLTAGDTAATIAAIVNDNPHAFMSGDANRMRVGVILTLPGSELAAAPPAAPVTDAIAQDAVPVPVPIVAPPVVEIATAPADASTAPRQFAQDAATAARLKALEEKFAAIRARYERQRQASAAAPSKDAAAEFSVAVSPASPTATAVDELAVPEETAARLPEITPTEVPSQADTTSTSGEGSFLYLIVTIVVGALVLALVVKAALMLIANARRRRVHVRTETTDAGLRAEIAAKAEKRVKLESEVKRRIEENRQAPDAVAETTIERAIESTSEAQAIDEAETKIAHGHYSEAEDLLLNVIAKTPNNYRAKLRLAEIYYLNERREDFVRIADVIYNRHREEIGDENWQRIMRMGKIIAPERPPFSGPAAIESEA